MCSRFVENTNSLHLKIVVLHLFKAGLHTCVYRWFSYTCGYLTKSFAKREMSKIRVTHANACFLFAQWGSMRFLFEIALYLIDWLYPVSTHVIWVFFIDFVQFSLVLILFSYEMFLILLFKSCWIICFYVRGDVIPGFNCSI